MSDTAALQAAEDVNAFLLSDIGIQYMLAITKQYEDYHRFAESVTLSIEQKAFQIERAAGLKWSIDWLANRNNNYINGYYDKQKKS